MKRPRRKIQGRTGETSKLDTQAQVFVLKIPRSRQGHAINRHERSVENTDDDSVEVLRLLLSRDSTMSKVLQTFPLGMCDLRHEYVAGLDVALFANDFCDNMCSLTFKSKTIFLIKKVFIVLSFSNFRKF